MAGICCPECGEREMRPWPVSRSEWLDCPVKICPQGHEVPIISKRAVELVPVLSADSY